MMRRRTSPARSEPPMRRSALVLCLVLIRLVKTHGFLSASRIFRVCPGVECLQGNYASHRSLSLFARKKAKSSKARGQSTSGFGGAATEPCPCGSGAGYMKCCGKLHTEQCAYIAASAEQVVRARYSAYAKRKIDFIMSSTHPLNKDFVSDIQHWKETIARNCYDNFELTECEIVKETNTVKGDEEEAIVQFVATMIQRDSSERTAFMETSVFKRGLDGAWLYREGVVEAPPDAEAGDASVAGECETV